MSLNKQRGGTLAFDLCVIIGTFPDTGCHPKNNHQAGPKYVPALSRIQPFKENTAMRSTNVPAAMAAAMTAALCAPAAYAAKDHVVYTFTDATDGGFPQGGVIQDGKGNFFGTTTSGGTGHNGVVYELTQNKTTKAWTQTTLYAFTGGNDGGIAQAGLVADAKGNLFGTTYAGGASGEGVVFELSPPANGGTTWTETTLWTFTGGNDGGEPTDALVLDSKGNLYGTTDGGGTGVVGTVFELSPPSGGTGAWTETVLYNFTGNNDGGEPYGSVLLASDGNIYGTTAGYGADNNGTIFKLAPSGKSWALTTLHAFAGGTDGEVPRAGLLEGANGVLYGDTAGFAESYGNVFSINTDGSGYKVIWTVKGGQGFTGNGPWQGLSLDPTSGALYGATLADGKSAAGEVFKLTPPTSGKKWTGSVLHVFQPGTTEQIAYTPVLITKTWIYGTTYGAAGESGFYPGTVWRIAKD